jgi:hypothetical protein
MVTIDAAHEAGIKAVALWLYSLVTPPDSPSWNDLTRTSQEPYYREARTLVNRYQLAVDACAENAGQGGQG